MTDPSPPPDDLATPPLRLARLLAGRVAHDIGNPLGTLTGLLEMLDNPDPGLLEAARQTAAELRARLDLQRAAWAEGAEPADEPALQRLLGGSPAAQRVRFGFAGPLFAAPVPAALVPLVLNAALLAAEALPRGGSVAISGTPRDIMALPEGRNAAWPPEVMQALTGMPAAALDAGPRRVVAPLLLELAAAQGFDVALLPGMGPGVPALLLTRRV